MKIAVELQPTTRSSADVEYTWDPDTEILSAQVAPRTNGDGASGSLGVEGRDGSWLILDVQAGRINGVEVAVWPDVRKLPALNPPTHVEDADLFVPSTRTGADVASMELETRLVAESDPTARNFHFRLGKPRDSRTVRVARNLLVDVDDKSRIAGLWLLNVPPAPADL